MKQKKAIIFFSAGLGDAVLLIPLVKRLKQQGFRVSGFFNSVHLCEEIFSEINLLDEIIVRKSKWQQFLFSIAHFLSYDSAFVNYFSSNRTNLSLSGLLAKAIYINKKPDSLLTGLFRSKMQYIKPVENIHDAQQNINLLQDNSEISLPDFFVDFSVKTNANLPAFFIAVQISAGNNKVTYKNWPIKYWIDFLKMILQQYPQKKLVLLGDNNEVSLSERIMTELGSDIASLIGKTSVTEAMNVLAQSDFFIGLDGGLMHLAVALKKPTFTIWGPSSSVLYGYEKFSPLHSCISLRLACNPCSAWITPNHTKAISPETCPDHACLQQLKPQDVFNRFKQYVNLLPAHAD